MSNQKKIPLTQVQAAVKRVIERRERKEVQVDMFERTKKPR